MAVRVEYEMRVDGVDLFPKYALVKEQMGKHLEEEVVAQEEIDEQFDSMVDAVAQ